MRPPAVERARLMERAVKMGRIGGAILLILLLSTSFFQPQFSASAAAVLTVTPLTWNVIGLDSNNVNVGPNDFPVGARVCNTGDTAAANVISSFVWDSANSNVNLRPGTLTAFSGTNAFPSLAVGSCTDFYYEVEVTRNAAAYNTTRRYHITASADGLGTFSSTTPREIFVEHLISQSRNGVTDIQLSTDGTTFTSVPAGGTMTLVKDNTYWIKVVGGTATNGYNQLESFINLPNTIFQVQSVNSTYTVSNLPLPHDKLYADSCGWDNDPNSPTYRSCVGSDGKSGGGVTVTYKVKILSVPSTPLTNPEPMTTLLYDFSGSSYHYNSDNSVSARYVYVVDPATAVNIGKTFTPSTTVVGGTSTLTFTLANTIATSISGANFTDTFPGGMTVAASPAASTSGCGTPTFAPTAGAATIAFSNGTIAANGNCTISVNVTASPAGTYNNTSGSLFIGTTNTGKTASATLTVGSVPAPPACTSGLELARWTMETAQGTAVPPSPSFRSGRVSSAVAAFNNTLPAPAGSSIYTGPIVGAQPLNYWQGIGWLSGSGQPNPLTDTSFQFTIDTSNFTGVQLAFQAIAGSFWANPHNNDIYVFSSANGGAYTFVYTNNNLDTSAWVGYSGLSASATGSSTTSFRIIPRGRSNGAGGDAANVFLDNISITGCGVPQAPTITKAFSTNPVAVGGTSTLTFTLTNENNIALTGTAFTDTLPAGVQVAATPAASTTCGGPPTWSPGAGATVLTFGSPASGTIPTRSGTTNGTCTIQVNVVVTTAGPHTNISGYISTTQTGTNTGPGGSAAASITALLPPSMTKLFSPNPTLVNVYSTLTFTIVNPNPNNTLAGVAFSDAYPLNVVNLNPSVTSNTCGGSVSAPDGGTTVALSGGTLAAGGSCTVTVRVVSAIAGNYPNTSGNVSTIINAATVNGNTAGDTLVVQSVHPSISILKRISTTSTGPWTIFVGVPVGSNVYYQFTVENTGDVALTSVNVTDPTLTGLGVNLTGCAWANMPLYDVQTCVVGPVTALSGSHANTATAHGTYSGTVYDSTPSTASYATTGLTIVKSVTEAHFSSAGDVLHYSYLVTNSGSAPLAGPVTVSDDKSASETCPDVSTVGDLDAFLDPGESITCTATYTIAAGDITTGSVTNIAFATVGGVNSPSDSKTVPYLPFTSTPTDTPTITQTYTPSNTFTITPTSTQTYTPSLTHRPQRLTRRRSRRRRPQPSLSPKRLRSPRPTRPP
jgi:uncharacterized repeat protein (TIGR01451 family)